MTVSVDRRALCDWCRLLDISAMANESDKKETRRVGCGLLAASWHPLGAPCGLPFRRHCHPPDGFLSSLAYVVSASFMRLPSLSTY